MRSLKRKRTIKAPRLTGLLKQNTKHFSAAEPVADEARKTSRGRSPFKQRDVARALKAMEKQGRTVRSVEFDGFSFVLADSGTKISQPNDWDEVLEWQEAS